MKRNLTLAAALVALCGMLPARSAVQPSAPRLVVHIVVSQMRYDCLARLGDNLSEGGLRRFEREGLCYEEGYYNYMLTTTPASLATLTTGANPSMHGVVGPRWIDYTTNRAVHLIADADARGLDCDDTLGRFSPANLSVPTFADGLREASPESRVVTVASDPLSAVVMGGLSSQVYWIDRTRCSWATSTAYRHALPAWVARYNEEGFNNSFLNYNWQLLLEPARYRSTRYSVLDPVLQLPKKERSRFARLFIKERIYRDYERILYTPAGNTVVLEFARTALIQEELGRDEHTDVLNICLDTPRLVGELYGPESMESEDMYYRLDRELEIFFDFLFAQYPAGEVLVVLTSDHGASDSFDAGEQPRERFNARQFCVILNGFLNAQYGPGDWVLDYVDRQLYLNHDMIYAKELNLEDVQNRLAAFALQFRGVSHVMTSTAMQNSYFGASYAQLMQNSYYPRRSGDLTVNLMPGWIEEREQVRSLSGSMYGYDTHVPLMWLGWKIPPGKVRRQVDMCDVAPTLARIVRISRPIAATGKPLEEIAAAVQD